MPYDEEYYSKLEDLLAEDGVLGTHFHCEDAEPGSESGQISIKQGNVTRKYIGPYVELENFLKALFGHADAETFGVSYKHPQFPWLYATSASFETFGAAKPHFHVDPEDEEALIATPGESTWPYVRVTVTFESPSAENGATDGLTIEMNSSTEILSIEGSTATFASGQKFAAPYPKEVMSIEYVIDRSRLDAIPDSIFACAGKVNETTFQGKAAGTVLFTAVKAKIQIRGMFEDPEYSLNLTLKWRQYPHNHEFNPAVGDFEELTWPGSKKKYQEAELNDLLS